MTVHRPGHRYELENFEAKDKQGQIVQFIEKEPSPYTGTASGAMITVCDGTTNEEVLAMLIDRMGVLFTKFPSQETEYAIQHLQEALMWLEQRTRNRIARGVEGKHLA